MGKRKTSFTKILMYLFLAMVVLGFTLPGFLDFGDEEAPAFAQRVCQSDADCYLMCGETPLSVLCYHNLCQQDSCLETPLFPYQDDPFTAQLVIDINQTRLDLQQQAERLGLSNFFVKFQPDSFLFFSSQLRLNHVLDKLGMDINAQCLTFDDQKYCQNQVHQLKIFVNGSPSYSFGEYPVKTGDQIKIIYS